MNETEDGDRGRRQVFLATGPARTASSEHLELAREPQSCGLRQAEAQAAIHHPLFFTFCGCLPKHEVVLQVLALRCSPVLESALLGLSVAPATEPRGGRGARGRGEATTETHETV